VTRERADALAASLDVGLDSPGLCLACLTFVAFEEGGDAARDRQVVAIAHTLWIEGFGASVRKAVRRAARDGIPDADDALRELDRRLFRSTIFRAVIARLGEELREDARRRSAAIWN
jgi:hypothetical protein